ncbi:uncharacterized protein LOC144907741 [Branchiostoma floridae x Branchiostoma belcheri]
MFFPLIASSTKLKTLVILLACVIMLTTSQANVDETRNHREAAVPENDDQPDIIIVKNEGEEAVCELNQTVPAGLHVYWRFKPNETVPYGNCPTGVQCDKKAVLKIPVNRDTAGYYMYKTVEDSTGKRYRFTCLLKINEIKPDTTPASEGDGGTNTSQIVIPVVVAVVVLVIIVVAVYFGIRHYKAKGGIPQCFNRRRCQQNYVVT